MKNFEYLLPESYEQAVQALEKTWDGPRLKAGGVDLIDELKEGIVSPAALINLCNIQESSTIKLSEDGKLIVLSPLVTLEEASTNEILLKHTGHPIEKIIEDTDRDNFMLAEEAKEYGLIDNVLEHIEPAAE